LTTKPVSHPQQVPGIDNFARISDVFYRGGQPSELGFLTLRQMGIKTVVDLRGTVHRDECEGAGLKAVHIPASASHPNERQIVEFLRVLRDPANQPLFIHDDHGRTRTGLYVAAYRMVEQGWSARDAEVEMRNFQFDPFWKQIPQFLERLDVAGVREELNRPPSTEPARNGAPPEPGDDK
jgi:protein tyrosine phosphatase (PTP) superfamily phosphohydrolase (DUF442 family)